MNPLFHLFITHTIADYPLQNRKLIQFKEKSYFGVLLHTLVHLVVLLIILFPFLYLKSVWIGIGVIFVTHNIIDQTKITLDKKYPDLRLPLYFLDQMLHLVIIAFVALYIGSVTPNLPEWMSFYTDKTVVLYVLILLITTYFYDVTRHFVRTRKKKAPYKRDYKMMLRNVFIVSIAFAIYWLAY